jgi:uncharacterized protein YkwD
MPKFLPPRKTVVAVACALAGTAAFSAAPAAAEDCTAAGATVSQVSRSELVRGTLCLLNRERADRGLPKLRLNRRLSRAARRHSRDMVVRRYFAHGPFVNRIKRVGYLRGARSWSVGENIAWGSGRLGSPGRIVRAWMDSPGHRKNILGRWRHVGIGIKAGSPSGYGDAATYTTDFGRKSG